MSHVNVIRRTDKDTDYTQGINQNWSTRWFLNLSGWSYMSHMNMKHS